MKMERENEFSKETKLKCFQLSFRHCCLCDKQCSTKIEIDHLIPISEGGDSSFDNAIPLCFDCHAEIHSYNDKHPKGNKYRIEELKERRNQIYDKYTSPFVPNIHFEIKSFDKKITDARFTITNVHQYLPCRVKTIFSIYLKNKLIHKYKEDIYGGVIPWVLNPNSGGNFPPGFLNNNKIPKDTDSLRVEIEAIIIDKFDWEHKLFPVSWNWSEDTGWYFHPFDID